MFWLDLRDTRNYWGISKEQLQSRFRSFQKGNPFGWPTRAVQEVTCAMTQGRKVAAKRWLLGILMGK
jgi:hypothetical protein